jgi:hypothetical protein
MNLEEYGDKIGITDFRLAGFLVARGAVFVGTEVNSKGEVVFMFSSQNPASGESAVELLNKYPGSSEQRYDAACKTMHDFVKVTQSRKGSYYRG